MKSNRPSADVVTRSLKLSDNEQLDPPAALPALFRCMYRNRLSASYSSKVCPATGCVFPNGEVCVMPDRVSHSAGPCLYTNMRTAEASGDITQIVWGMHVVLSAAG